jgi:Ni,Fe-hydrogenase III small subunit
MLNLFKDKFPFEQIKKDATRDSSIDDLLHSIKLLVKKKFSSKLKIYIVDAGSCKGCELELQFLFSPQYNLAALGFQIVYAIDEADILLITGLMTHNMSEELEMLLSQFKDKRNIVLIGDCPIGQSPFQESFALDKSMKQHFSLAYSIIGCPPNPKTILEGFLFFLNNYEKNR